MIYTLGFMDIPYMEPFVGYYQYMGWYYVLFVVLCALLLGIGLPCVIVLVTEGYHRRLENNTNADSHTLFIRSTFEICLFVCVISYVIIGMFVNIDRWNSKQILEEWFKNKHITLKIKYVKENRPMTVTVYRTKITKKAMNYVQLDDTLHNYNNRQVVITKYVKKKPVNWQAIK